MILVASLGVWLRGIDVWRPLNQPQVREADVAAIARNFAREGMNILYPRIDWRGDGPGFVESEFPLYPWLVAIVYRSVGIREEFLRLFSFLMSIVSAVYVYRLSRLFLDRVGTFIACLFFAVSSIAYQMASAVQAEPLMFAAYSPAAFYFLRWSRITSSRRDLVLAGCCTSLAILAKLPALQLGVFFAFICLGRFGLGAFRRGSLWAFAAGSLAPPLLWYAHARQLWGTYGNSLGISDEALVRLVSESQIRALPSTLQGILSLEVQHVWTPPGLLLAGFGAWVAWREPRYRSLFWWLVSLSIYYVATGRTTGESWAAYYHVISLPVVALLVGLCISKSMQLMVESSLWWRLVTILGGLGSLFSLSARPLFGGVQTLGGRLMLAVGIGCLLTSGLAALQELMHEGSFAESYRSRSLGSFLRTVVLLGVTALMALSVLVSLRQIVWIHATISTVSEEYLEAKEYSKVLAAVPSHFLMVVSSPESVDAYDVPQASNRSYFLYWLDRKGFTLPVDQMELAVLLGLRQRGASHFVLERNLGTKNPIAAKEIEESCSLVLELDLTVLVDLTSCRQ